MTSNVASHESAEERFYSTENVNLIYQLLGANDDDPHGQPPHLSDRDVRQSIVDAMQSEYRPAVTLIELNKSVLRRVLHRRHTPPRVSAAVGIRDLDTHMHAAPPLPSERPQHSRTRDWPTDNHDDDANESRMTRSVQEQFDKVAQERGPGDDSTTTRPVVQFAKDLDDDNGDIMERFNRINEHRSQDTAGITAEAEDDDGENGNERRDPNAATAEGPSTDADALVHAMTQFDAQNHSFGAAVEAEHHAREQRGAEREDQFQSSLRLMNDAVPETSDRASGGGDVAAEGDEPPHHHHAPQVMRADGELLEFPSGHVHDFAAPLTVDGDTVAPLDARDHASMQRLDVEAQVMHRGGRGEAAAATLPSTEQIGQLFSNAREVEALQQYQEQTSRRAADEALIERTREYASRLYNLEVSSDDRVYQPLALHELEEQGTPRNNRFAFHVDFSSSAAEYARLPRFVETPWESPSTWEAENGHRGRPTMDFVVEADSFDTIDGYDVVRRRDRRVAGPNIKRRFRNVEDIAVTRVHLFATKGNSSVTALFAEHPLQYPYLLLHIDELGSQYDATNDELGGSFCRLYMDKTWKHVDGAGTHYVFIPPNNEKMVFRAPIANLDRLTFRLTAPSGKLLDPGLDVAWIKKITIVDRDGIAPPCGYAIQIQMRTYQPAQSFQAGHTVVLQDIEWFFMGTNTSALADAPERFDNWKDSATVTQQMDAYPVAPAENEETIFQYPFGGDAELRAFREFLQRPEGHLIQSATPNGGDIAVAPGSTCHGDEFLNTITIAYPYDTNYARGATMPRSFGWDMPSNPQEQMQPVPNLSDASAASGSFRSRLDSSPCINGAVRNRTMQTLISLVVNCREEQTGIAVENV